MPTSRPPSDPWRRRVHALLAKAESTEYPAEAETLLAKAQELMARHAIDEAMLRGGHDTSIGSERVVVEPPYAGSKASLLSVVARANGCRVVISGGGRGAQLCVLVGPATGRANARSMFTALSMHATRQMLAAAVPPHDTPRRFRHAFLLAFAHRIGERLAAVKTTAEHDAEAAAGRSVSLVLVGQEQAVDAAVAAEFPDLRLITRHASSGAGVRSGRTAADRAGLGAQVGGAPGRQLQAP